MCRGAGGVSRRKQAAGGGRGGACISPINSAHTACPIHPSTHSPNHPPSCPPIKTPKHHNTHALTHPLTPPHTLPPSPQVMEGPGASELLHRCYVYLAGSHANPEDLRISAADLRLGLRQAALTSVDPGSTTVNAPVKPARNASRSMAYGGTHRRSASSSGVGGSLGAGGSASFYYTGGAGGHDGTGNSSGVSGDAPPLFHVPLARVAAFLRQAGLVPRLFQKYITQLQRMAEEAEGSSGATLRGRGLPVMPSLKASLGPLGPGALLGVTAVPAGGGGGGGGTGMRRFRWAHVCVCVVQLCEWQFCGWCMRVWLVFACVYGCPRCCVQVDVHLLGSRPSPCGCVPPCRSIAC